MTEDQIERRVEVRVDAADRAFMAKRLSQAQYDVILNDIAKWADEQYAQKRSA